jgi:predicted enzyme related to lactoylglutathione lyase
VGILKRIAPVFAVRDLSASLSHYQRLGFATREYVGGGYGFATRDGTEIHLGLVPEDDTRAIRSTAYIWVDDADELAQAWRAAGADVHLPEDTDWGQHEGVLIDPDGNIIRFASPMGHSRTDER